MTKERLKELIKQGAMIYDVSNGTVRQIDLSEHGVDNYYIAESNYLALNSRRPYMTVYAWDIECLYETREQAEWHLKNDAERTERFEPPMWEEIKDKYTFAFFDCYDCVVRLSVFKNYNSINHIVVYSSSNTEYVYYDVSTKENYEKACEIVRDLFGGGAK